MDIIYKFILSGLTGDDEDSKKLYLECKIKLLKNFQSLGMAINQSLSLEISNGGYDMDTFIERIIYEILNKFEEKIEGVSYNTRAIMKIVSLLEEVFKDLEYDNKVISGLKVRRKLMNHPLFSRKNFIQNTSRRRSSCDGGEGNNSLERGEEKGDKYRNQKIDSYFKPKSKEVKSSNATLTSFKLQSHVINSSLFPVSRKKSGSSLNSHKNSSSYTTSMINNSYATFYEQPAQAILNTDSMNINSLNIEMNPNSNFESSRALTDINIKRPHNTNYIMGSASTMQHSYNFSSSKSTHSFGDVSQFSFNPLSLQRSNSGNMNMCLQTTYNNPNTPGLKSKSGINYLLASKMSTLPKTKKTSIPGLNGGSKTLSNKKKKNKEKIILIEKFKEKVGRIGSNSKAKPSENVSDNIKKNDVNKVNCGLKKIVDGNFYPVKLGDVKNKEELAENNTLQVDKVDISKNNGKIAKDKNMKNDFLSQKRVLTRSNYSNTARHESVFTNSNKNLNSSNEAEGRSRSVSLTDDEILAYQTPVKTIGLLGKSGLNGSGVKTSPGATTRKNLFNLFNQIDKSA